MIRWSGKEHFLEEPFELERDLEKAVVEVAPVLFGSSRIYINTKRRIGAKDGVAKLLNQGIIRWMAEKVRY